MKIAIKGGNKQIKYKMPPRFAFGSKEQKEVQKMIKYYRTRGKIQNFLEFGKKFSNLFSKYQGGGHSNIVATGTGAIYIAMKALELPKNSDVLICPVTCAGNFSCITEQGHNPILLTQKNELQCKFKQDKRTNYKKNQTYSTHSCCWTTS